MLSVIYTLSNSILAIPWCVGGAALAAGIVLIRRDVQIRFKILPFGIALFALGLLGPSMLHDKIEITPQSFHLRTGLWWSPTEHRFLMKDVVRMEIVDIPDRKGKSSHHMRVIRNSGMTSDVPMGDLFRSHKDEILTAVTDALNAAASPRAEE